MLSSSSRLTRRLAWRGVAWRSVAWRGVAWRGEAWLSIVCERSFSFRYGVTYPLFYCDLYDEHGIGTPGSRFI